VVNADGGAVQAGSVATQPMTIPDSHRDLLEQPVGTIGTIGADLRPQLSEVWFVVEDDTIKISLNNSRQKLKNLDRSPGVSFLLLDLSNPYRYLEIRGDATIDPDPGYEFADRVGKRYGSDLRQHDAPGTVRKVVTIVPTRVVAVDMTGS
jgi:PPOX class probable F420-dependent enzyme